MRRNRHFRLSEMKGDRYDVHPLFKSFLPHIMHIIYNFKINVEVQ